MFITQETKEIGEDGKETINIKKNQQRIIDSKNEDMYFVTEGSREVVEFKGFDWDETISHVNGRISKAEAYVNRMDS